MTAFRLVLAVAVLLTASPPAIAQQPGGEAPRYTERILSKTPLDRAIRARLWAPGLNEGFVPQGLTMARGALFLGAYRSTDTQVGRGPARVFAVDPATGDVTGAFDLPASIGHADGLAATPDGQTLYVADNGYSLYAFDLPASLIRGAAVAAAKPRKLAKDGALIGSNFLSFDGERLWFGRYAREGAPRLLAVTPAKLFGTDKPFAAADADRDIPLPLHAQGATFDAQGRLWISASNTKSGRLYRIDAANGAVLAEYPAVAGLEDLARGESGLLWSVSEAGSQRWNGWSTFFPLLFAFDPEALR